MINRCFTAGLVLVAMGGDAYSHGLIEDPPSRNWFCGAITKPDEVLNGVAEYQQCGEAFANDFTGGYQFMSVLSHDQGRSVVNPLPEHVCGFDSETWQGGGTPWDVAMEWPTTPISAGPKTFTWNIAWGPHFFDTEEFRYWITNSDFQFSPDQSLSWSDFEETPFCVLNYSDQNPGANPAVVPDKANARFYTTCEIPERAGRHVIYAEWGRNYYTFERFHGCVDVIFDGSNGGGGTVPVSAAIELSPDGAEFVGAGVITLDASVSQGGDLSYEWSVESQNPALYSIDNAN